jgi:hypothetical protein
MKSIALNRGQAPREWPGTDWLRRQLCGQDMARKKKARLSTAGTAFAFPLGDGRFSVCRILLDTGSEDSKQSPGGAVLVACSRWIGDEVPHADDPALRPILHLNHHSWDNRPHVLWISDEPPEALIPIGKIKPTAEEQAIPCASFGNWSSLMLQPLAQWRWDNERAVVLAEDVIRQKKDSEARLKAQQDREQYLERITLDELRGHRFFPNWKGYPPPKAVRASRKLLANTVEKLLGLGPSASEKERMAVLQECIESFNELDAEMRFIETIERENICEEFEAIVHACGLGGHKELADRWREW